MEFFDTQILVYAAEGRLSLKPRDPWISSVVAQEFLLFQRTRDLKNEYYLPLLRKHERTEEMSHHLARTLKDHPPSARLRGGKRRADFLIMEFGKTYPTVAEYSHIALSDALNARMASFILAYAECLDIRSLRVVESRLRFLRDEGFRCKPLVERSARMAQAMLYEFGDRYALKKNFRNTLNDIMALAVAVDERATLITDDRLLATFSRDYLLTAVDENDALFSVDFSVKDGDTDRRPPLESKGYINSQWRVRYGRGRPR